MSREQYKTEINKILEYSETYQILNSNPTKLFKKELDSIVRYGVERDVLNKSEENPRLAEYW